MQVKDNWLEDILLIIKQSHGYLCQVGFGYISALYLLKTSYKWCLISLDPTICTCSLLLSRFPDPNGLFVIHILNLYLDPLTVSSIAKFISFLGIGFWKTYKKPMKFFIVFSVFADKPLEKKSDLLLNGLQYTQLDILYYCSHILFYPALNYFWKNFISCYY